MIIHIEIFFVIAICASRALLGPGSASLRSVEPTFVVSPHTGGDPLRAGSIVIDTLRSSYVGAFRHGTVPSLGAEHPAASMFPGARETLILSSVLSRALSRARAPGIELEVDLVEIVAERQHALDAVRLNPAIDPRPLRCRVPALTQGTHFVRAEPHC